MVSCRSMRRRRRNTSCTKSSTSAAPWRKRDARNRRSRRPCWRCRSATKACLSLKPSHLPVTCESKMKERSRGKNEYPTPKEAESSLIVVFFIEKLAGVAGLFGPGRASPLRGRPTGVGATNDTTLAATSCQLKTQAVVPSPTGVILPAVSRALSHLQPTCGSQSTSYWLGCQTTSGTDPLATPRTDPLMVD